MCLEPRGGKSAVDSLLSHFVGREGLVSAGYFTGLQLEWLLAVSQREVLALWRGCSLAGV